MTVQVCTRCLMDTTDKNIVFDVKGQCNHCTSALERLNQSYLPDARGKALLDDSISNMKEAGKGRSYDCVIGLSGGLDSSYLAYKTKEWGLRSLLVHVNGGWNTPQSESNVEKVANYLGYDLHVYTVDWDEMRDLQIAYLKSGLANQDVPQDHLFFAVLFRESEKAGIRYWLSGSNLVSESILPSAWGYTALDARQIKAVHQRFGKKPLNTFPLLSFFEYCKFYGDIPFLSRVQTINPLNVMPYNLVQAKNELTEAIGWQDYGKKHDESLFTKVFQNYWLPEKFGYQKRKAHLSSLIVSGVITRDEALRQLEEPLYAPDELAADISLLCERLELSTVEWDDLMRVKNADYTEYPNYETIKKYFRVVKRFMGR